MDVQHSVEAFRIEYFKCNKSRWFVLYVELVKVEQA